MENVEHPTSNAEVNEDSRCHSMFDVGCSSGFMERRCGRTKPLTAQKRKTANLGGPTVGNLLRPVRPGLRLTIEHLRRRVCRCSMIWRFVLVVLLLFLVLKGPRN